MSKVRKIYKLIRTLLLGIILSIGGIYVLIYTAVSIPWIQDRIKKIAEEELSALMQTDVHIGALTIKPISSIVIKDVSIPSPDGSKCIEVKKIAAGLDFSATIGRQRLCFNYGEILGLDAAITQKEKDGPLNIQFLIDAFKPREDGRPPAKFDFTLSAVVVRGSHLSFDRLWAPSDTVGGRIDINHIDINDLRADISLPLIKNDHFEIDLRRMALRERSGFILDGLTVKANITPHKIALSNLHIVLPGTSLHPADISLETGASENIGQALASQELRLAMENAEVTPADMAVFYPPLKSLKTKMLLNADIIGNLRHVKVDKLSLHDVSGILELDLSGSADGLDSLPLLTATCDALSLKADLRRLSPFLVAAGAKNTPIQLAEKIGTVDLTLSGDYASDNIETSGILKTPLGSITIDMGMTGAEIRNVRADVSTQGLNLNGLFSGIDAGQTVFDLSANLRIGKNLRLTKTHFPEIYGTVDLEIPLAEYNRQRLEGIAIHAVKEGENLIAQICSQSDAAAFAIDASVSPTSLEANANIESLHPALLGIDRKGAVESVSGDIAVNLSGTTLDDLSGNFTANDICIMSHKKEYRMRHLQLDASHDETEDCVRLACDYADAMLRGHYTLTQLPAAVKSILATVAPSWFPFDAPPMPEDMTADFSASVKADSDLSKYVKMPVTLLQDLPIRGHIDTSEGVLTLNTSLPWLQQGRNKLIRDTSLDIMLNALTKEGTADVVTTTPMKSGTMDVKLNTRIADDRIGAVVGWKFNENDKYHGSVSLNASSHRDTDPLTHVRRQSYRLGIEPSVFVVNDTLWNVAEGSVDFADKRIKINNIDIGQGDQNVNINGLASESYGDTVRVKLANIDLDYLFETLAINYVNFGGKATGDVYAAGAFSKSPHAYTDNLYVEGLKYNNAILGNGHLNSHFDMERMAVLIGADIRDVNDDSHQTAAVDGGIWVTRDSLGFDISANKANAAFVRPFFQAFASDVDGIVTGKIKLYGTFSDVNLTGTAFADTVSLKVDYTNVYYSGSDSVIMTPGRIHVPGFRVYDRYGNSGIFSGDVYHDYFHNPTFDFVVKDCQDLLCFDTNESINPIWYGTIFGNGGGNIKGWPGYVGITIDMTNSVNRKSSFTFVLSDTEEAEEYKFLTFSDRRKESMVKGMVQDTVPLFVKAFQKKVTDEQSRESVFDMSLRGTVNPQAELVIVMDPVAGDKIVCHGNGYMQVNYQEPSQDFTMNGTYTIDDGIYNFSLQDIILKKFTIEKDSKITFNGDPFNAVLDIEAAHEVNTNLTDLDKSFATDKELNRTSVPVQALLKVSGRMTSPEIGFDIKLPSVSADATRKVKSIISTEDMMSQQIIYLLALGRFYTPEYMGSSNRGGEWASVASSTISSQIANMIDNLNDKWSVAPSFHSDKGDFSDIEFDLALSSRLLNNRLLFNGNLGYRDKSISSTSFIGDFDIEYLLNASGNLRLKAYNRYNDQNYYLRSALTTQGIGIVYKRDFNDIFSIFRRSRKKQSKKP